MAARKLLGEVATVPPHYEAARVASSAVLALLAAGLLAAPARAQPTPPSSALPNPVLLTVTPPGGQAGSTVEVTFTGDHLEEPETLLFSHAGLKAEPVVPP